MKELLPVKYYHAVFTMPHQLNSLVMGNRKAMFTLLFDAASYALLKFAKDEKYLAAQPGIIAVLAHVGSAVKLSSACSLHCKRRWYNSPRPLHKEGQHPSVERSSKSKA
ncbi:MAG: hypothetical protein WKG06_38565 [Segetibacter sp.]